MSRTRCPFCSRNLSASDIRPFGVVFRCPHCGGDLKIASSVPRLLPMTAYLGWLIAFAAWGIHSFWGLIPLAFIATLLSVSLLSGIVNAIGGVSLDPVSERGTLALGETRDSDDDRVGDRGRSETQVRPPSWLMTAPIIEAGAVFGIALFFFAIDWSGFNKWDPDLFSPKPFRDVWWHFPVILALVFFAIRLLARGRDRER
jgi:hypothetical protein